MSQAPGRELLNQDPTALDVPQVAEPTLPSAKETGAYAPIPFATHMQGMLHPKVNPDVTYPIAYPAGF